MKIKRIRIVFWPEFLTALYFFFFALIKPVINYLGNSTLILLIGILGLLCIYIYKCKTINTYKIKRTMYFSLFVGVLFLFSSLLYPNGMISIYLTGFILNGVILSFFLNNVSSFKVLLKYFGIIGTISGIVICFDPFNNYSMFGTYMSFGYEGMLPAFCASLILTIIYNSKYLIPINIVFLLELFLLGSKGAGITALIIFIMLILVSSRTRTMTVLSIGGLFCISTFVVVFSQSILKLLYSLARYFSVSSYSLNTISMMINGKMESIITLRTDIWEVAIKYIHNNVLTGIGIGTFTVNYGTYPHNIFLDILLSFGLLIFIFFVVFILYSVYKLIKANDFYFRVIAMVLLIMWILPMSISLCFWQYMPFWMYINIMILEKRKGV